MRCMRDRPVLRNLTALAVGFVAMLTVSTTAAEVRITVNDRSAGGHCAEGLVLSGVSEEDNRTLIEVPLRPRERTTVLTLDDTRSWRVSARKDRCWSSSATWIPSSGSELTLDLFSSATLQGKFAATDRSALVLHASLFRIVADQSSAARWSAAEPLDCSVDLPKWQCTVPASLPIDVRLEPKGFAPVYLWNPAVQADKNLDTGTQKLVEGASLSGWVQDPDAAPLAGAAVTLSPLQPEHPEAGRVVATQHRVTSNAHGFFQFTGVSPGDYRLVSNASALSPVVVPVLTVHPSTAVTWPRPLRHAVTLTLNVTIDPVKPADGSSWRVVVMETVPLTPGSQPVSIPLSADEHALWSATGLRADRYVLVIRDSADSVVERREIDLSDGAPATLNVSIRAIAVRGVVKVGDETLAAADLRFTNSKGKAVSVTTDENGRFTAVFPSDGRWNPLVYPYGRQRRTEVRATPVEISADDDAELEIVLPGGRIRGTVVTQGGAPVRAAVHVVRDGELIAQQTTSADGKFDFIGLKEAAYAVSAEADDGVAPAPTQTRLAKDQTTDLKIVIEPYRVVRGTVQTPGGQPASGAIVRSSTDGGWSWSDQVAGVRGDFEYFLPAGTSDLELVVVSYSYPTAMLRIAVGNTAQRPLSIRLLPLGGSLRVDPDRAFVIRQDVVVPLNAFYLPRSLGVVSGAHLEPGSYAVCKQQRIDDECQRVLIAPGTSTTVSFRAEKGKENAR
jgi:hypothetical protein